MNMYSNASALSPHELEFHTEKKHRKSENNLNNSQEYRKFNHRSVVSLNSWPTKQMDNI